MTWYQHSRVLWFDNLTEGFDSYSEGVTLYGRFTPGAVKSLAIIFILSQIGQLSVDTLFSGKVSDQTAGSKTYHIEAISLSPLSSPLPFTLTYYTDGGKAKG